MLKYQREPLASQTEEHESKMQMVSRRIVHSLLIRNNLQSGKFVLPYAAGFHYNLTSAGGKPTDVPIRNYASAKKEQKLLNFPAIPLSETVERFMKSAEPFMSKDEKEEAYKHAQVFLRCDAPKLQKLLEKEAKSNDNWLADRWLRVAYLQYRDPVTIYSSPGMTFPRVSFKDEEEYLNYTAKVIFCLIKYKELIDRGKIPVVKMGNNELDNGQFGKVLGTCRIPHRFEDKMQYNPKSLHVAVIYKNHFYKLRLYSKNLNPLHPDAIREQLQKICQSEREIGIPFGILTSDKRDTWANAYQELNKIEGNRKSVEEIEKSLFTVSLDGEVSFECGNKLNVLGEILLHGCGSNKYAGNRWFDKTIQLIVSRSGFQGFCYEHSPAEGQPIALMVDFFVKHLDDEKLREGAEKKVHEPAKKLVLKTSQTLDKFILTARKNVDQLAEDIHLQVLHFKDYGKGFLKQQKLSPDSFVQMAFQYAFYKMYKEPGACYESAHLRIFRGGRTETIRSCSNESMAFAKAMYEPCSDEERVSLMRKAVNNHRLYTGMALQGRGVDRHLFGLKRMAIENNLPIPEFFNLPAFKKSTHFRISSSQVASSNPAFMCYGPMFHDGYACCYNPRENDIYVAVSSWRSCEDTNADRFANAIKEALLEMSGALCRAGNVAKKEKSKL